MSRWPTSCRLFVDYSQRVERAILHDAQGLADWFWSVREITRKMGLQQERIPTTRDFKAAAREVAARPSGLGMEDDQIKQRFMAGWTEDERDMVLAEMRG